MVAEARFTLRAVDETQVAFASVQNNLARLQQTAQVAGKSLTKSLDVKDAMRSVALAVGLSVDKIADFLARAYTGTSKEQEELSNKALDIQERLGLLQKKNAEDRLGEEQLLIKLQNERVNLQNRVSSNRSELGTEGYVRFMEDSVALEETIARINVLTAKKKQDIAKYTEEYGRYLNEAGRAESELDEVLGKQTNKEALINNLWDQRAMFLRNIRALEKDRDKNIGQLAVQERNLAEVTRALIPLERERRQLAMDVGDTIARGFENAALAGNNLREVVRGLAQDLIRLVFQNMVTKPLAAGIGNFLAGFRASGGPVSAGSAYVVGERGPELFVPSASGAILPNSQMGGGGSSGAVGSSVNVTYNIASGVSRAELAPLLENERKRLKAEIPDMVRRGGAYRAAFA